VSITASDRGFVPNVNNLPREPQGQVDPARDFRWPGGSLDGAENTNPGCPLEEFWIIEPAITFADLGRRRSAGSDAGIVASIPD